MTLRTTAQTVTPNNNRKKCGIHELRLQLDRDDNNWLDQVLPLNSGQKSTWISEVLMADGHQVSHQVVQRHRNRRCGCAPSV